MRKELKKLVKKARNAQDKTDKKQLAERLEPLGKYSPVIKELCKLALSPTPVGPLLGLTFAIYDVHRKKESGKKLAEIIEKEIKEVVEKADTFPVEDREFLKEVGLEYQRIEEKLDEILKEVKQCGFIVIEKDIERCTSTKDEIIESEKEAFQSGMTIQSWNPFIYGWDVGRDITPKIEKEIEEERKNAIILGESGMGKTVILRRIAYDFHRKGWKVYLKIRSDFNSEKIVDIAENDTRALIVIDDMYESKERVRDLLSQISALKDRNVSVLIAERIEFFVLKSGEEIIQKSELIDFRCSRYDLSLTENDAKRYLKFRGVEWRTAGVQEFIEKYGNRPGAFLLLGIVTEEKEEKVEYILQKKFDAINRSLEGDFELKKSLLRIFLIKSYEGEYPKEILVNAVKDGWRQLMALQKKRLIIVSDSLIETFHPFICREFIHSELNERKLYWDEMSEYLEEFLSFASEEEYVDILLTVGILLADEGARQKHDKKIHIGALFIEKVLEMRPNYAGAHYNYGYVLMYLEKYEDAKREWLKAIKIKPDFKEAYYNIGLLMERLGSTEEAALMYKKATQIDPDYADAHNNLGVLLLKMQKYPEAVKEFREVVRVHPGDSKAEHNLLSALIEMDKEEEIENGEALPFYAEGYYSSANFLVNVGRYDEAEREYRRAIRINPKYAAAHYNLGVLYAITGKTKDAKNMFLKARELFEKEGRTDYVKKCDDALKAL